MFVVGVVVVVVVVKVRVGIIGAMFVVLVVAVTGSLEKPPVGFFEVELAAFPLCPVSHNVSTVAEDPARSRG